MLIKNGTVVKFDNGNNIIENGAVYIENGIIQDVGNSLDMEKKYDNSEQFDAGGNYIMPGMICSHFHAYSQLSRGMFLKGKPPRNFIEILKKLWWKFDKALKKDDLYYSGLVSAIEAVKNGTTCIIDHNASPYCCTGSLETLSLAFKKVGVRGNYCYEVSERDGMEIADEGLKENYNFIKKCIQNKDSLVTGSFGMHAAFTISDETFKRAVDMAKDLECGFHIHVSEGMADEDINEFKYGKSVVERLQSLDALGKKTIAVHGVNINDSDIDILAKHNVIVVHNPESNMNNAVGIPKINKMMNKGILVGLGTDGFTTDMFREIHVNYIVHKLLQKKPYVMLPEDTVNIAIKNNGKIVNRIFGKPAGKIEKGYFGDIIIVDYNSPTPINSKNFSGHMIFGLSSKNVKSTIINGKVVMENGVVKNVNEEEIMKKSTELTRKLWKRI